VLPPIHDKVQEAACSLIAEQDKDKVGWMCQHVRKKWMVLAQLFLFLFLNMGKYQYQKDLGHVLYSVCKGQKLGEALLPIVDRINHGLQSVLCAPAMCIDVAELNLVIHTLCVDIFPHLNV
jgi:hypothetical protein